LLFVSQYHSCGVSVERISREILVFVSWPGGRCRERASMISCGTGFDATDDYNRKCSVACSTFQSFFGTQVWHRRSSFLCAKFDVRHHSLLRLQMCHHYRISETSSFCGLIPRQKGKTGHFANYEFRYYVLLLFVLRFLTRIGGLKSVRQQRQLEFLSIEKL
jgi:hypothetical protein